MTPALCLALAARMGLGPDCPASTVAKLAVGLARRLETGEEAPLEPLREQLAFERWREGV